MEAKLLKVNTESKTGLNTSFVNENTNRVIPLEQAIEQINKGNSSYKDYHVVTKDDGTQYVRSNPDRQKKNNIED